jgi:acyl-CoA carboxylase subunit beta
MVTSAAQHVGAVNAAEDHNPVPQRCWTAPGRRGYLAVTMSVLASRLDQASESYRANRSANLQLLEEIAEQLAQARAGGGPKYVERHRARGKLLARERVELLLDRDGPFLELSPLAAWGSDFPVGASGVTGVGPIEGVECVVAASDPTVRGGATNPFGLRKTLRAMEIAERNRLPLVQLIESSGADLPTQSQIFIPGGIVR